MCYSSPPLPSYLACTGTVHTLRLIVAFVDDWEQQVWLCKSKVSVFLPLLSLAAPRLQKYRIQLWKVQFATGIALPFKCDLSLISRGRSELRHECWKWTHSFRWGFHPFKCHPIGPCLGKVVQFFLSHLLLCVLECACLRMFRCMCCELTASDAG